MCVSLLKLYCLQVSINRWLGNFLLFSKFLFPSWQPVLLSDLAHLRGSILFLLRAISSPVKSWHLPLHPALFKKRDLDGNFLAVQWLRLCTSPAGSLGSIPGCGTKIPHAVRCGQKQTKQKPKKGT